MPSEPIFDEDSVLSGIERIFNIFSVEELVIEYIAKSLRLRRVY